MEFPRADSDPNHRGRETWHNSARLRLDAASSVGAAPPHKLTCIVDHLTESSVD
jgi:hypothetical protein